MIKAVKQKLTMTAFIDKIAEEVGMTRADVKRVLVAHADLVRAHVCKGSIGVLNIPFLGLKAKRVKKKATKARKGTNPFTGEEMMFKAKPASTIARVTTLKKFKDFALS